MSVHPTYDRSKQGRNQLGGMHGGLYHLTPERKANMAKALMYAMGGMSGIFKAHQFNKANRLNNRKK